MSKVRIGFVGAGFMGQVAHLRNYVTLDDCEVVALAEVRKETGTLVAQRYGIPKLYDDHDAMFAVKSLRPAMQPKPSKTSKTPGSTSACGSDSRPQ